MLENNNQDLVANKKTFFHKRKKFNKSVIPNIDH